MIPLWREPYQEASNREDAVDLILGIDAERHLGVHGGRVALFDWDRNDCRLISGSVMTAATLAGVPVLVQFLG